MTRIDRCFGRLRKQGNKAFIPYLMAGHPDLESSARLFELLEESGADIIELGVPFSDPLADGPTIQAAAQAAREAGVTLSTVLGFVSRLREKSQTPIVLMTYYNPVFKYGETRFVEHAKEAGADGVIIPDLPPDEAGVLIRAARKTKLDTIFLLAPTSTEQRIRTVVRAATGFVYYVPILGITGSQLTLDESLGEAVGRIRTHTGLPVAVGFGVSTPQEASSVASASDGVIVGSAIVKRAQDPEDAIRGYLRALRDSIA